MSENTKKEQEIFCLTVNFKQDITSPHVLFTSIADMIIEMQKVDKSLTTCIDSQIEPMFVLDEVEKGSIKVWLKQILTNIPDEAISELDAKKVLGSFLVRAKHKMIESMAECPVVTDPTDVEALSKELTTMATETNLLIQGCVSEVNIAGLLGSMNQMSKIARKLPNGSSFGYTACDSTVLIVPDFDVAENVITNIQGEEKISNDSIMIIKVKQPDYIGNAQWIFKYDNVRISCILSDEEWLNKFHSREVDVRPGDSLKVKMNTIVGYDKNNDVVSKSYTITEVLEVIPPQAGQQLKILLDK